MVDTKKLYDESADKWVRREPNSLSDFTGRPPVFALCGDVGGVNIVDLGAGEGYCARVLAAQGAKIEAIELSPEMVRLAQDQEEKNPLGINFQQGTVTDLPYDNESFDLALGVFVYNYLHIEELKASFKEVFRVLKPGGRFVFSVPHPAFPFIKPEVAKPFYFDFGGQAYLSAVDKKAEGEISCRDGRQLPVQMIHKRLGDYAEAVSEAGFAGIQGMHELGVLPEHMELDPNFFGPVEGIPLHLAFDVRK